MPRVPRADCADEVYHVLNRRVGRATIFSKPSDYLAFEELLKELSQVYGMRILAYCIMPNHWHLVLQPTYNGHLAKSMHWLTTTHTRRWHQNKKVVGEGSLYQGRYKSFPVETNDYLMQLIYYVEQNPLRAKLVPKVEEWQYSSLYQRILKKDSWLSDTIISLPNNYLSWINTNKQDGFETLRTSVNKGIPFGSDAWVFDTIEKYGLQSLVTKPGRPKKY